MPIEEVAGSIFKVIARVFIFIFLEIFWDVTCQIIGNIVLRIVTFGKYPPPNDEDHCEWCVQVFGLIILLIAFIEIVNMIV